MSSVKTQLQGLALSNSDFYSNVEISLLAFNERVLKMARNPQIRLFERLKFLCIFCSNLDDFFEKTRGNKVASRPEAK